MTTAALRHPGDDRHTSGVRRCPTVGTWGAGAFMIVALTACGGGSEEPAAAPEAAALEVAERQSVAPGSVTPEQAAEIAAGGVTVIDVRTPEEFAEGHLDDATLIDFYDADFAEQLAALPRDEPYLVYCRSGNRSGQAAAIMDELGFDEVYDMDGGVIAYAAAGLPLVP